MKRKRSEDGKTVTVRVPITIRKRGGRRLVLSPDGRAVNVAPVSRHVDSAMVKAIARAFRWRDMLESGEYATIREIAEAEKINESYVSRIFRLTLLAPDLVESVLDGGHVDFDLSAILQPLPIHWEEQRKLSCR